MTILQFHQGGANPWINANNGAAKGQGLPSCDRSRDPTTHNTTPYKHLRFNFNQDDFGSGCICKDCTPLAVGDVITIGEIGGGRTLKEVQWDVFQKDPTFKFDLEVRKVSDLTAAGVVIKAGLGDAVTDGAAYPDLYFSKYGVPCPGKDCYGQAITPVPGGYDHGMLCLVVKALPTGQSSGCAAGCTPLGLTQASFDYVVSDLR